MSLPASLQCYPLCYSGDGRRGLGLSAKPGFMFSATHQLLQKFFTACLPLPVTR